eukprot:3231302-Pyramimonas_sp.AAC.1
MGMTEAAPVQGPPELQEKSLQTSEEAEGDAIGFMAVRSTESHSMASVSAEELRGRSVSDPISVRGQDAAFASGQRRGLSYGRALRDTPDHVGWHRKVKKPREDLVLFLGWASSNFIRKEDGQFARASGPKVSSGKVLPSSSSSSGLNWRHPGPLPPHPRARGCKIFSGEVRGAALSG